MIDLCIVNYNTRHLLNRFLDCLHNDLHLVDKKWNLYIADNNSSDDTQKWIKSNDKRYHIDDVKFNDNVGYSAACNQLAAIGSSEIICLLNADVWMDSYSVSAAMDSFSQNTFIDILGPKQRDENGFITHAGIVGSNVDPKHRGWKEHDPNDILYRDMVECVTVSGSAYFIRRSVWDSLTNDEQYRKMYPYATGAFLPTPHYYEETWCSYFARHKGYKVFYDGSISIGHSWHKSSSVGSEADGKFPISRDIFRKACDFMGIERD